VDSASSGAVEGTGYPKPAPWLQMVRQSKVIMLGGPIERNQPASLRIDRETIALPLARRSMPVEDLNNLLGNEQIELLMEQEATCDLARATHRFRARGYARLIRDHRHPYRSGSVNCGKAFAPYPFGSEGQRS